MKTLYVEDNSFDADLTRRELARHDSDYQIDIVPTLEAARTRLKSGEQYDLVLLDLHLPDGNGLDLLAEIREQALPIAAVVLTGSGDEEAAIAALKAGADDYLAKHTDYPARLPQVFDSALKHFHAEITRQTRPLRVLYAEHTAADIDLTRRHLARHAPHIRLDVVHTANEILERIPASPSEPHPYDVVLLDFHLPGTNTLELLKVLRQDRGLDLPIVLITGKGSESIATKAWQLGATDYLIKNTGYLYKLPVIVENAFHRVQLMREQIALRESEARYRRLTENAQDLIYRYRLSPTPGFEYVNPAAMTITGYTPEEYYANPELAWKMLHPHNRALLELAQEPELFKTPIVQHWVRKNGTDIWTEQHNTPVHDNQGNLIALEGIIRDITKRKRAEEQLRESEEGFRLLFESNPHPMWVYDLKTLAFLEVNDAAVNHYGYTRDEFLSMRITDIRPLEEVTRLIEDVQRERPTLQHSGEWRHRLKNGQIIDVEITSHTLNFAGRQAALVVAQDITERKQTRQAEYEQRMLAEALADTATALNSTLNLDQVLDRILVNLGQVVPHDAAYIMLIDSDIAYVTRCWGYAAFGVEEEMQGLKIPVADLHDLQWMATHLQPYLAANTRTSPEWTKFHVTYWANSYVGAPLFREGQVIGFLGLLSQKPNFFNATHSSRLQAFANQAATGILNAQLFTEERNQRTLAQALRDTASALISAVDIDTVMNTILEIVARVVPHAAANIMLIEGDTAYPVYWRGYRPEQIALIENFQISIANTPNLRLMFETGTSFLASHTDAYSEWINGPLTMWVKSYIAAPICSHDNVIGFLNLDSEIPGFFTETHAQHLQVFADQASIAIEHAQLYEEIRRHTTTLEHRVEERTAQLNQTLKRLEATLNSSDDIIILCDPDGIVKQTNPAFSKTFNCNQDEALGQPLTAFAMPTDTFLLEQAFQSVTSSFQSQRVEITVYCTGHTTFDADVVLSPIIEQATQISGVICSIRDITQRKQMEVQLRQMLEREMELGELKSRYISMAAHDLRNPLAVIQSSISLIHQYGEHLTSDRLTTKFDQIQTNINVMVEMLDDILTLGKVESGKLNFNPAPIDIIEFCENLVAEVKQATATAQTIKFSSTGTYNTTIMDIKLLRHILGNLLSNAIKYSPQDRPINLTVDCTPEHVIFSVQDHGIGIPAADQQQLFETFHRASNARAIPGTGLGLAIVKQSVTLHGGTITFESEEDHGTTFTVTIPQVIAEKSHEKNPDH